MPHTHALENALTSWFRENPVKKAILGYATGFTILVLLLVLVQFLIAREKEERKLKKIEVNAQCELDWQSNAIRAGLYQASWRVSTQAAWRAQNVPNSGQATAIALKQHNNTTNKINTNVPIASNPTTTTNTRSQHREHPVSDRCFDLMKEVTRKEERQNICTENCQLQIFETLKKTASVKLRQKKLFS